MVERAHSGRPQEQVDSPLSKRSLVKNMDKKLENERKKEIFSISVETVKNRHQVLGFLSLMMMMMMKKK